jgi:hypothetical protein
MYQKGNNIIGMTLLPQSYEKKVKTVVNNSTNINITNNHQTQKRPRNMVFFAVTSKT